MANNPKLEKISIEFSRRINDAVTAGNADGDVLTAVDRMSYINKAMLKMVDDVWLGVNGDKKDFARLLPELIKARTITVGNGLYVITSPNLDFFQLSEAVINNGTSTVQASVISSAYYETVLNGKIPQLKGDADNPMVIESGGIITFAPLTSFAGTKNAVITIIKLPINGYDGSFLQMATGVNLEDSPFYNSRNSQIAENAAILYKQDASLIS